MGKGGQIWLKCITVYLIMMIRDKNNIFERVKNFHADLAWNYPNIKIDVNINFGYLLLLLVIFQVKIDRTLVAIEIYMTKQLKLELEST